MLKYVTHEKTMIPRDKVKWEADLGKVQSAGAALAIVFPDLTWTYWVEMVKNKEEIILKGQMGETVIQERFNDDNPVPSSMMATICGSSAVAVIYLMFKQALAKQDIHLAPSESKTKKLIDSGLVAKFF